MVIAMFSLHTNEVVLVVARILVDALRIVEFVDGLLIVELRGFHTNEVVLVVESIALIGVDSSG